MKIKLLGKYLSLIAASTIFVGGLFLRMERVLSKVVWGEEAIYLEVARDHSFKELVLVKHWLIDHPQLYLILLHFWSRLGTSPFLIRLPNMIAYLVSFCFIFQIGKLVFENSYIKYLLLGIYALFPYYLGIDWQAVPYSMAMMFFLGSMVYLLKLISGDQGKKTIAILSIFLTLFLYTSFESIYFFASIILFLLISRVFRLVKTEVIMKILLGMLISLFLFSPEIFLVLSRVREFPNLSSGLIGGDNSILIFLSDLFALSKISVVEILALLATFTSLTLLVLRDETKEKSFTLVFTSLVASPVFIYFISNLFFEVRHPRAYYFIIFEIFITLLIILDHALLKSMAIKWSTIVLFIVLILNYVFRVDSKWLRDEYLYSQPYKGATELRNQLQQLLKKTKLENKSALLLLDNNIKKGNWYEGVYFYEYYFKCLDLKNKSSCDDIKEVKNLENIPDTFTGPKHETVIGVMVSGDTSRYFLKNVCPLYQSCYLWNFKYHEFRKIETRK